MLKKRRFEGFEMIWKISREAAPENHSLIRQNHSLISENHSLISQNHSLISSQPDRDTETKHLKH